MSSGVKEETKKPEEWFNQASTECQREGRLWVKEEKSWKKRRVKEDRKIVQEEEEIGKEWGGELEKGGGEQRGYKRGEEEKKVKR